MISWNCMLLSYAKVAPDLLKVWKPWPVWGMFLWVSTFFNASLMCVSITWEWGKNDWQIMGPREGGVWIQAEL